MTTDLKTLIASLESGTAAEQMDAAEKLAKMETDASGAAVALAKACATDSDQVRDWVVAALEGVGPPAASDVPALAALVKDESLDTAYWAATLLGRLKAQSASAVPALIEALGGHPDLVVRQRAAWAIGQIGSAAGAARDALTQAAESPDHRLATLAREALGRL